MDYTHRRFNPIWKGHKKNSQTLSKYLTVISNIYSVLIIIGAFVFGIVLKHGIKNDIETGVLLFIFLMISSMFMYLFSVYREFWYITPSNTSTKFWKWFLGFWIVLFLLINIFQIMFVWINKEFYLFSMFEHTITYGTVMLFINVFLGLIGTLIKNMMIKFI